ncbi:NDMA-dependent alcohol dehydrogenase [Amycolatopsis acidicola]|uniref:NDMA-dependent alcohol dehydrogenase n=1 Tax=Amycolatopsis acidicola TaxID=2596893 RepID=A0A5N0USV7_9PSEU|nr:NDMA-dependent alcohol dehydrogenase [Amycolatopsis acidicola]KAA9153972.1 NDMA-dependent alcohol dehydrogenase [Amycolatopsis acidicola]
MKSRAAVLLEAPGKWDIVEVDVDEPQEHEVLVRYVSAGLCHSDDHLTKGDVPSAHYPYCGGHEGAGIVEAVGPGVRDLEVGDHVVAAFIPGCGRCKWCSAGMQNLCDNGAFMMMGTQLDGTFRLHHNGADVAQCSLVSTFSEYSVLPEWGAVKIDKDIPLDKAALVGCGVATGWGSAVNAAAVKPGHVVIVMGVGGIGINAVQGAKHAGATRIIAVDPVEFKRKSALEFGATDAVENMVQATDLAQSLTYGQGADSAIVTVGVVKPDHVGDAFAAVRKAGTVVVTGVANVDEATIPVSLFELAMFQKRIQGALYGMLSPSSATPFLLDLYRAGALKLDELVSRRYSLEEINQGYEDMHAGTNIRGVIDF